MTAFRYRALDAAGKTAGVLEPTPARPPAACCASAACSAGGRLRGPGRPPASSRPAQAQDADLTLLTASGPPCSPPA
jgi:hypothetical protein